MKYFCSCVCALFVSISALHGAEKLPRGEDVVYAPAVGSTLSVHNAFQSNMVIQRDKPISIWGWGAPGEAIAITFADQKQSTTAGKDRRWRVKLPAMAANSQAQKLTIQGKDKALVLENVLIGDIWVLGGQSNMEHPLSRVEDGDLEIASANFPNIRVLTMPAMNGSELREGFARLQEWSGWWGRHFPKGDWDVCSPDLVRELSAIGYVFARRLHMTSQVPIGVVDVSRGGTTVETWTPDTVLRAMDTAEVKELLGGWDKKVGDFEPQADLEAQIAKHNSWVAKMTKAGKAIPADRKAPDAVRPGPAADQNRPGNCYASMLAPIAGFSVKGVIWHQGYNNALQSDGHIAHKQILPEMIKAWRAAFNDPALPFGIISLCTTGGPQTMDNYLEKMVDEGIYIRSVQYEVFTEMLKAGDKNIGFASSYDMRRSWYHPGLKAPVGERIARWALASQYGKKLGWQPPMLTEMKAEEGKLLLTFNTGVAGLKDWSITGFAIAGDDRQFQPAKAEYLVTGKDARNRPTHDKKVLVLSTPHVSAPQHFRFAWGRNPVADLRTFNSTNRAPFATQRSDTWRLGEVPLGADPSLDRRASIGRAKKAMKDADLQRRLKDAQAFIDANSAK